MFDTQIDAARSEGVSNNFKIEHEYDVMSKTFNYTIAGLLMTTYHISCEDVYKVSFGDWFLRIFGYEFTIPAPIYWCAIFAARKDSIQSRPKAFYEALLESVSHKNAPIEAHFLERSWFHILSP